MSELTERLIGLLRKRLRLDAPAADPSPDIIEYTNLMPLLMCRGRCALVSFDRDEHDKALRYAVELELFRSGIRAAINGERHN